MRDALKSMLESWGAEVVAEGEPGEAFYRQAAETQDVIALVSDYNLGADKPNGLEAAGMIEAHMKRPVPTVMLTAVAVDLIEGEYRKRREEGRVAPSSLPHILQKPADARSLNEAIGAREARGRERRRIDSLEESRVGPQCACAGLKAIGRASRGRHARRLWVR